MDQFIERYKLPLLFGAASIGLILVSVILIIKSIQPTTPIVFSEEASVAGILLGTIQIDIEGAVSNPGVYELPAGSRVEDAIMAAGGLSDEADTEKIAATINRAAKVVDGGKFYIPKVGEESLTSHIGDSVNSSLVNINLASQSELEALPGVGPVTSQKIIAGRPYQTLEELISKKAVGTALFDKIKNQLAL